MIPALVDQVSKGLSRNIDFLDKENFNKLIQLFLEEVQEIEVATLAIADQKSILTAIGEWLDYIGKIVGEPRKGRTDQDYRAALLLKVAINTSDGTPNTIIDITKQYTGVTSSRIIDYHPASFFNVLEIVDGVSTVGLAKLIDQIKPAGVSATVVNNINGNRFVPSWQNLAGDQTNTDHAYFDWIGLKDFNVFTGGGLTPLTLSNGNTLSVTTSANISVVEGEGLLAQVVVN
jgi:hypothetical protein